MGGAHWDFIAPATVRQQPREVEVLAIATPSGAAWLLVFDPSGRVTEAHFLRRPWPLHPVRSAPPGEVPAFVLDGAGAERRWLVGNSRKVRAL